MIASEGGAPAVSPGGTTGGTGVQTSVSSGLGFACTWAKMAADMETRAANVRTRETRMFIDGYENNTRKSGGDLKAVWESWEGAQGIESRATDWPPEAERVPQA